MRKTRRGVPTYLASLPEDVRADMTTLEAAIAKAMGDQPRAIWEGVFWGGSEQTIIGYGDYVYQRGGKELHWFKVGLALQKAYISVYVNAVTDGAYVAEHHKDKLGKAKVGKSSVSFKKLADINLPALMAIVKIAAK